MYRLLVLLAIALPVTSADAADPLAEAADAISEGVRRVHGAVQPGEVRAVGEGAVPVLEFADGKTFAVAGVLGRGRFVVFPDHQTLNLGPYGDKADHGRMVTNALAWSLGLAPADEKRLAARIAVFDEETAAWLRGQGFRTVAVVPRGQLAAVMREADVVLGWLGSSLGDTDVKAARQFLRRGGAMLLAEYGHGYRMWWKNTPLAETPAALVLQEAGVLFPPGFRYVDGLVDVRKAAPRFGLSEARAALESGDLTASQLTSVGELITDLVEVFGEETPEVRALREAYTPALLKAVARINPTEKNPVTDADAKSLLTIEAKYLQTLPAEETTAHRTAEAVYGAIPRGANRVTRTLTIDAGRPRWHSTGLYAVPGELITVRVPKRLVGKKCLVRLSGHVDNVTPRDQWKRLPLGVDRTAPLDEPVVTVASPFGGAVYIDTGKTGVDAGEVDVTIEGAIEAPWFRLGETTDEDWVRTERKKPAPYAELNFGRVSMSLPSEWVRDIRKMQRLAEYWDAAVAEEDRVGGFEGVRKFPERINVDVQISAGLLHAGYPIQGPFYASRDLVNYEKLITEGDWGYFHELGHEMQARPDKFYVWTQNPFTFEGDGEVTVNIFANAALEKMVGAATLVNRPNPYQGWGWSAFPGEVKIGRAHV